MPGICSIWWGSRGWRKLVDRGGDQRASGDDRSGTKHQALLARLSGLAQQEDTDDAAAITSLRQQLQAVKVTGRQKVNLDPDEVRVAENGNPSLEGDYTLWLPAQPSTVTVMGLLSSPGKSRLRRAGTWRAISTSKVCSAERITAMPGWSIRTGIRRKRRWLTGINAISNLCRAASFCRFCRPFLDESV